MTNPFFPSPHPIAHLARAIDAGDIDADTGNPAQTTPAPAIRYAQSFAMAGRSRQVISPEFVKRIDTELTMAVSGQCAPGRTAFRDAFPRPDVPLDRPAADTRHNWTLMTSVFPANLNRTFVPIREICRTIADQRKLIYQYK
jgi:hypothetical protein